MPNEWPAVRIFRIMFRSAVGKQVTVFAKVPYSGAYALTEVLTRALVMGEIQWFRLDPAKPGEITPKRRASLLRWPEALRSTSERSGVTWLA